MPPAVPLASDDENDPFGPYRGLMQTHFRALTEGTNINPTTLLTTDYLNHFSSIMMLLEMLPTSPEDFAPDIFAWEPKSYQEHFDESGFRDKELAVAAYEHAPSEFRKNFDHTIEKLDQLILNVISDLKSSIDAGLIADLNHTCTVSIPLIRNLIDEAAGIVNGGGPAPSPEVVAEEEKEDIESTVDENTATQDMIDSLFD